MQTVADILSKKRAITEVCYIVYALVDRNEIVYIGQTKNVLSRLSSHVNSFKKFDSWAIVENLGVNATARDAIIVEEEYIKRLTPKYNIMHNKERKLKTMVKRERKEHNLEVREKKKKQKIWNHIKHIPELADKFKEKQLTQ
jgi:excinuclease UvrABC nuclease subunit